MSNQSNVRERYNTGDHYRGDTINVGVRQADFLSANGIPMITNLVNPQLGQEYLERQRAWNDLDSASQDIKRDINRIGLVPIPERVIQSHYDLDRGETPFEDDDEVNDRPNPIQFDTFTPMAPTIHKEETKKPEKKQGLRMADLEKAEREREQKMKKEKDDKAASQAAKQREDDKRRKEQQDKDRRDKQEKDRLEREKQERDRKLKQEQERNKPAPVPEQPISSSVLNPFAKKLPGNKKLEPVMQPSNPKPKFDYNRQETEPLDIDHYDFDLGPPKKGKDEDIKEEISEQYSGFGDPSSEEEFQF